MSQPTIGRFIAIPTLAIVPGAGDRSAAGDRSPQEGRRRATDRPAPLQAVLPPPPANRFRPGGKTLNHTRLIRRGRLATGLRGILPSGNLESGKRSGRIGARGFGQNIGANGASLLRSKRSQVRVLPGVPPPYTLILGPTRPLRFRSSSGEKRSLAGSRPAPPEQRCQAGAVLH